MSQFNQFAQKLDGIAKEAFEEYHKAEATFKKAEAKAKEYPQHSGYVQPEYAAKSARAQADLIEAKSAFDAVRRNFGETAEKGIRELRKELERDVSDAFAADPAQLDTATMALLESGILNSGEYGRLLNAAIEAGNPTMTRMIGHYAQIAADAAAEKYGQGDPLAKELRLVVHTAHTYSGSIYLDNFDVVAGIFRRCVRNPSLIREWDNLTAAMIAEF